MASHSAKALSTAAIWLSVAVVLTFGVFRMSYDGILGILMPPGMVALLGGFAWQATREVWNGSPAPASANQTSAVE
jgi:hypothetical protein